ncbi:MAG: beta-N-acetylglucosaminidase domain-containing protein [Bacteroidales bacterium]
MKIFKLPILIAIVFFSIISVSCHHRPKPVPVQVNWLSDDPLTMPYRVRKQKLDKGNLVWNSSFEKGKSIIVDTSGVTFRIDGWQKIGNRVEWVNIATDSVYGKDEAYDSLRAVKIHRQHANETDDPGEGVISDFIKVIPGNYQFTFYIRLENIVPNRSRLGTRIFDAVNIKMIYYDKNKIEIKPQKFNPVDNIFFDNSFKGYSFSNFWEIKDMPWSRVIGKSCDIFSIDGDIPSDARYVKLLFALKGSGTMWLDMVDLRYSRENFSMLEKMKQFMDSTLYKQEIIIPTPKKITKLASVPLHNYLADPATRPLIIIPRDVTGETMSAARLIRLRITELAGKTGADSLSYPGIQIKSFLSSREMNSSKLIFSIGKTDLYLRFKEILPDIDQLQSDQGYFIYSASDLNNIVFLLGKKPAGDFYAATTAYQLFDNRKLIFHNANIIDYPDFSSRNIGVLTVSGEEPGYLAGAAMAKINGIMLHTGSKACKTIPRLVSETKRELGNSSLISFGTIQSFTCEKAPPNGQRVNLNMSCNEFIEKSVLFPSEELHNCIDYHAKYCGTMQELCRAFETMHSSIPKFIFPVFQNNSAINKTEGRAELYLHELNKCLPQNVKFLWSGYSAHSLNTDNVDLHRITEVIEKTPVFWDNSATANDMTIIGGYFPGKLRCYNLFEPFINSSIKYLYNKPGDSEIFFGIPSHLSELAMIRVLTIADFAWNEEYYDADFSVWKILQSRYGISCAKELVVYADIYANLLRNIVELSNPLHHQRLVKNTEALINKLDAQMHVLEGYLNKAHPLYNELKLMNDRLLLKFSQMNAP